MTGGISWIYLIAIIAAFTLGILNISRAEPPSEFMPRRVVQPLPAITDAPTISASSVTDQVTDKELVLATVVNGEARAYPINMLTGPSREIINDTLGNRPIAATW
jgi:hypothetical protein